MLPSYVTDREVIIGAGLHGAVYAATRVAMGKEPPVVLEKEKTAGGMFARLQNFRMNSANNAAVESVSSPGPTRIPSVSPCDDLNWLPNFSSQVNGLSGMTEYPYSQDMGRLIKDELRRCAQVYTDARFTCRSDGRFYAKDGGAFLGKASRIIFAGGLYMAPGPAGCPAMITGYEFMLRPVRDLAGKKIAVVGAGDTAAQVAEIMLGQGITMPVSAPASIHWYGGPGMPANKTAWMRDTHARWAGIGRHMPEERGKAVIVPYLERGTVIPLGENAMVSGQVYDLVVMATGFVPAPCPFSAPYVHRVGEMIVARSNLAGAEEMARRNLAAAEETALFKVGPAAAINPSYGPFTSRFPAASQAIYNLAPRTAALAASLP